jgi:hypothetical protein
MAERKSTKFYRDNEAEVMRALGLMPTRNSGAGWLEKSDGQNESIIAELKSTSAQSFRIELKDIYTNEKHAAVAHKIPILVVQFLESNEVFVLVRPIDLPNISQFLECGEYKEIISAEELVSLGDAPRSPEEKIIRSANRAEFYAEREREQLWKRK